MANIPNQFDIDGFKQSFQQGARGYLFYIIPSFPSGINSTSPKEATYLVRSSSLPGRTVEAITTNYMGYEYKFGGKSTVEDWTVTFTVDKSANIYNDFVEWIDMVHNMETNEHGDPADYMIDQSAILIDGQNNGLMTYSMIAAWPTSIAALDLAYDSSDALTFDVTFSYLYHKKEKH